MDKNKSLFDREMWASLFRDLWKVVKRYPFLAIPFVMLYMRFFERDALNELIAKALEDDAS